MLNDNTIGTANTKKKTTFKYNSINDMTQSTENRFDGKIYNPIFKTDYKYTNSLLMSQVDSNLVDKTTLETSYAYDLNGNLKTSKNKNESSTYLYDGLNRLTQAQVGGKTAQYIYNGEDKKVGKIVGTNKTSLIYSGDNVVEELINGKVSGRTYYGDKALFRDDIQNKQKYHYFYNTHNDVTELKYAGQLKKSYKYDAFGKEVSVGGDAKITVNNPIRYAGYYYEEESKLYYLNARMYNPTIKRFMQQDTVRGDSQNPNTLNLFAYSGNNPIANYDPTGNFFETFFDVVSLGMSIYDFVKEPSLLNFGMLAWDVVSLVPGIPGSYVAKGFKYADRIDDALDTARALDRIDDTVDTLRTLDKIDDAGDVLKAGGKASDLAKSADRANQARQAAKASKEAFGEVAEKTIKSGGDVVKDGRVIATSAKKAAQRSYEVVAKVNNKIADVQNKIFSKVKNATSKLQAYGKDKLDNVVTKFKDTNMYSNFKAYTTKKPSCFTADTLVKTENGLKPISEVVEGEKVRSVDEDDVDEYSELKTVTQVIETETDTLVNIVVDGEKIQTTKTHPWYVEGKGFTDAEYITVGDKVRAEDGEIKVVESIEVEILDEPIIVYNLEVEDNRTYYVGNNEILVHNACSDKLKSAYKEARATGLNAKDAYKQADDVVNLDFGKLLKKEIGNAPDGMVNAHAHHILFKSGNGAAQKKLVQEGQKLLREFDIDPIRGIENLVWAPNKITGQHAFPALENVVNSLKGIKELGGNRNDMVEILKELGKIASGR